MTSPFYALFDGAKPFDLTYPAFDYEGPLWDETGALVRQPGDELFVEPIEAVQLGPDHYRLADRALGPFSALRLRWGDEFMATTSDGKTLRLLSVVMPLRFTHDFSLISGPIGNDIPMIQLVHDMGGGWETVAGGMLTMTVPADRAKEFARRIFWAGYSSTPPA